MKRLFMILSNLVMCLFFVWVVSIQQDVLVYDIYPSVAVLEQSTDVSYDTFKEALNQLVQQTDSTVARQISVVNGKKTYELFGKGELPLEMPVADWQHIKQASLLDNYFIINGSLSVDSLAHLFNRLGFVKCYPNTPNLLSIFIKLFSHGSQLLGLLIFMLTFVTLIVVSEIKTLRYIGIRLISGERLTQTFLKEIRKEAQLILLSFGLASLVGFGLLYMLQLHVVGIYFMMMGLLVYNVLLLSLSLFIRLLLMASLKKIHLIPLIKGQLPLKSIVGLMLLGQLIAIIMVAVSVNRTFIYTDVWHQQQVGEVAWQSEKQWVSIGFNRASDTGAKDTREKQKLAWYNVMNEAVEQKQALLIQDNLIAQAYGQFKYNGVKSTDYHPQGHSIVVTPSYLDRQNVRVSKEITEKINHLQEGEYVLLLPQKLKEDTDQYVSLYSEHMSSLASSRTMKTTMHAIVGYLDNQQEIFLYNSRGAGYTQFLNDPIIVVTTPKAMGKQSLEFWHNAIPNYVMFDHLENAQRLFEKYGVIDVVGYISTRYDQYNELLAKIKIEVMTAIASAVLGIVTSVLLFNTLNLLYFEEFRRDIFIKKLSGMTFFELHQPYLFMQLSVLTIGAIISSLLSQHIWLNWLVFMVFIANAILLLKWQSRREERLYVSVLKGE